MTVVDERVIQRHPGWRDALRSSWLMDGPQDRGALLGVEASSALRFADFPTGRVIFAEGDAIERVYVIVSGMVKITGSVGRARPVVRALLGPGDVLDEAAAFDTDPHSVTATSQSLVRTGWVDKAAVQQMLVRRPRLALEWLRALAREIQLREEDVALATSLDVPTRVARQLVLLSQRFGSHTDGGIAVSHSLTRQEFAELVGATRASVSRVLATFVQRGWLVTTPGGFEITDLASLRSRAAAAAVCR